MENNLTIVKDKFKELPNNIEASILFGNSLNLSLTIVRLFSTLHPMLKLLKINFKFLLGKRLYNY